MFSEKSNNLWRFKVSVDSSIKILYVFKETDVGYERILQNNDIDILQFSEGENGNVILEG